MSRKSDRGFSDVACRVCLNVEELMVHIYEELEDLNSDLSTLLELCGNLKVDRADNYPKYLCKECTSELLIAAKFREKCSRSKDIFLTEETSDSPSDSIMNDETFGSLVENIVDSSDVVDCPIATEELCVDWIVPVDCVTDNDELQDTNEQEHKDLNETYFDASAVEYFDEEDLVDTEVIIEECYSEQNQENVIGFSSEEIKTDIIDVKSPHNSDISLTGELLLNNETHILTAENSVDSTHFYLNYACDICGAAFAHATNLKRHVKNLHDPHTLYSCEKCWHCFSKVENYKNHYESCVVVVNTNAIEFDEENISKKRLRVNRTDEPEIKICSYCDKVFKCHSALEMHLRTHTGERPFGCGICSKSFKTRSALTGHLKRHTGQPDFACNFCEKLFYEKGNLLTHVRSHTGEKPHSCTVCSKRFARVFLLQLHMRTHTGEKPYPCPLCDRSFAQQCDVKNHIQTHTGERKHQCGVCSKSFIKRKALEVHMQRHCPLPTSNS